MKCHKIATPKKMKRNEWVQKKNKRKKSAHQKLTEQMFTPATYFSYVTQTSHADNKRNQFRFFFFCKY